MKLEVSYDEYLELVEFVRKLNNKEAIHIWNGMTSRNNHIPEIRPSYLVDENGVRKVIIECDREITHKLNNSLIKSAPELGGMMNSLSDMRGKGKASWLAFAASNASSYISTICNLGRDIASALRGNKRKQ